MQARIREQSHEVVRAFLAHPRGSTSLSARGVPFRMDPLRVGIIGCGIGQFHADSWSQETRAQIVALAGLDTDRCLKIARKHNILNLFHDYRELVERSDLDAVSVGVPNH